MGPTTTTSLRERRSDLGFQAYPGNHRIHLSKEALADGGLAFGCQSGAGEGGLAAHRRLTENEGLTSQVKYRLTGRIVQRFLSIYSRMAGGLSSQASLPGPYTARVKLQAHQNTKWRRSRHFHSALDSFNPLLGIDCTE